MTREQNIVKARELRAEGLHYREIAGRVGVAMSTVYRWLNPEFAERHRGAALAWKKRNPEHVRTYDHRYGREHRGTCQECGAEMGIHIATDGVCRSCRIAAKEETWDYIERRWREGATYPMLKAELGWTSGHLSIQMNRMRTAGRNLPLRYRVVNGKRAAGKAA